ncbi:hypothetical protein HF086_000016, partial [Spodoptera exigua]
ALARAGGAARRGGPPPGAQGQGQQARALEARVPAAQPRAAAPAPAALRWGASWSSVVARAPAPAPLAPIGEHVRRRDPEPRALAGAGDNSLFYFNGDTAQSLACHDSDFSWRPPPPLERPSFSPTHDFLGSVPDEASSVGPVGPVGSGAGFRSLSSVWGAGAGLEPRRESPAAAAWLWGVRGARRAPAARLRRAAAPRAALRPVPLAGVHLGAGRAGLAPRPRPARAGPVAAALVTPAPAPLRSHPLVYSIVCSRLN